MPSTDLVDRMPGTVRSYTPPDARHWPSLSCYLPCRFCHLMMLGADLVCLATRLHARKELTARLRRAWR
eukprot:1130878-Rhodomonas_salina.1